MTVPEKCVKIFFFIVSLYCPSEGTQCDGIHSVTATFCNGNTCYIKVFALDLLLYKGTHICMAVNYIQIYVILLMSFYCYTRIYFPFQSSFYCFWPHLLLQKLQVHIFNDLVMGKDLQAIYMYLFFIGSYYYIQKV